MKIKLLRAIVLDGRILQRDKIHDLPEDRANALIRQKDAVGTPSIPSPPPAEKPQPPAEPPAAPPVPPKPGNPRPPKAG